MSTALITGAAGQDGILLARQLIDQDVADFVKERSEHVAMSGEHRLLRVTLCWAHSQL